MISHRTVLQITPAAWLFVGARSSDALVASIHPTADTFITAATQNGTSPDSNYGNLGAMTVAGSASGNGGEYLALLKFDPSGAVSQFNTEYGAGQWSLSLVTLRLAGNFATQGAVPGNARFPAINGGAFSINWFSNDSWTETGATYKNFTPGAVLNLGNFSYVPPGDNVPVVWMLNTAPDFISDISANGTVSLQLAPGDSTVSYLFNTRTYSIPANFPLLSLTAIPEPSALALLACGSALLLAARRTG
jgi:hypothetical protein